VARQKPRYGYRRLWAILAKRGDGDLNVKRVHRIDRQENLAIRRVKRKRVTRAAPAKSNLSAPNQAWAIDFVSDSLSTGRGIRSLTIVDSFTRECPAIEVATSLNQRACNQNAGTSDGGSWRAEEDSVRQRAGVHRQTFPRVVRNEQDHNPSHSARASDAKRPHRELQREIPGRVPERGLVPESEGCTEEDWRKDYNGERPHSSLGYRTPEEYAKTCFEKIRSEHTSGVVAIPPDRPSELAVGTAVLGVKGTRSANAAASSRAPDGSAPTVQQKVSATCGSGGMAKKR
jgi:putative transposase